MVSSDRGQLLLVGAFMVAVVVVASAVLLNGIIVPSDTRADGVSADTDNAFGSFEPRQSDLTRLFEYTTSSDAYGVPLPYADASDLSDETEAANDISAVVEAHRSGTRVSIDYNDTASQAGAAAIQWGTAASITDSGSGDWTVLDDAETVESVWINASADGAPSGPLGVIVTDGAAEWKLELYPDQSKAVAERPDGTVTTCRQPHAPPLRVSLSRNGAVTQPLAERCPRIHVGAGVAPPYDVRIVNGDEYVGEYAITGTRVADVNGQDELTGVVVNPAFDVRYVTSDVTYESTFAVNNGTGR